MIRYMLRPLLLVTACGGRVPDPSGGGADGVTDTTTGMWPICGEALMFSLPPCSAGHAS